MDVVFDAIQRAARGCDFEPHRADDLYSTSEPVIMQDIWSAMNAAEVVIADCTGRNPNVMYELGIAHTLGKRVLLLSQRKKDIPFDIGHLRVVIYEASPTGLERLHRAVQQNLGTASEPVAPRRSLADE
jgi:hypothetical protein